MNVKGCGLWVFSILTCMHTRTHHNTTQMAQLDIKMQKLNSSLDELQDMRREMASMGSMLDEYQDQLHGLSTSVGDAVHTNTVMQDAVQGFSDNIGNFSVSEQLMI